MQSPYRPAADAAATRYGIPPDLFARLIDRESSWDPRAWSGQAAGLTQLKLSTAAELGVDPWDPVQNLDGGARYLRQMFDLFGSWERAVRAYHHGPGNESQGLNFTPQDYVDYIVGAAQGAAAAIAGAFRGIFGPDREYAVSFPYGGTPYSFGGRTSHGGVDLILAGAGPLGSAGHPFYSPIDGRVVHLLPEGTGPGTSGSGGHGLIAETADGLFHHFYHLGEWSVSLGQQIVRNQELGTVGLAGPGDAHLHYEVRATAGVGGATSDPMPYLAVLPPPMGGGSGPPPQAPARPAGPRLPTPQLPPVPGAQGAQDALKALGELAQALRQLPAALQRQAEQQREANARQAQATLERFPSFPGFPQLGAVTLLDLPIVGPVQVSGDVLVSVGGRLLVTVLAVVFIMAGAIALAWPVAKPVVHEAAAVGGKAARAAAL